MDVFLKFGTQLLYVNWVTASRDALLSCCRVFYFDSVDDGHPAYETHPIANALTDLSKKEKFIFRMLS